MRKRVPMAYANVFLNEVTAEALVEQTHKLNIPHSFAVREAVQELLKEGKSKYPLQDARTNPQRVARGTPRVRKQFNMPLDLIEEADRFGQKFGGGLSGVVRAAIVEWLEKHEWNVGKAEYEDYSVSLTTQESPTK